MNIKRPSFFRVIQNDYIASLCFLLPIVFLGFAVILFVFEYDVSLTFLAIAAAISVMASVALAWRYSLFLTVFDDALETPAIINDISFFRGRGHVSYIYTFQGQKYQSRNVIQRTKRTKSLRVGQAVVVLVDRNNPKRAFIRDIYL